MFVPLVLYNTLSRKKEEFRPAVPGHVSIYSCGPTVYRCAHIGNLRTYLFSDVVRRTFELAGYQVRHVMNVTDVGHLASDADEGPDKVLEAARREKKTPLQIARFYEEAFFADTDRLNILRPHVICRATDHIQEMIDLVGKLLDLGVAYQIDDGIYFSVERFPAYGQLSNANLDGQLAGARVEINRQKRHPADFALWKKAGPEHSMSWPSPWGEGYPGWHIECSAMAMKYLGNRIDIHTGGIDHIPIHHENEIAQADAAAGHRVVNCWLHGEFLVLSEEKMSKSTGNVLLLDGLIEQGSSPLAFRYLCLNSHYRKRANFTWEALAAAGSGLDNLRRIVSELGPPEGEVSAELWQSFADAVFDDFNMPRALASLWEGLRNDEHSAGERSALAARADSVLGLSLFSRPAELTGTIGRQRLIAADPVDIPGLSPDEASLVADRERARADRDWPRADALRAELAARGVRLEDAAGEVKWVREQ